MSKALPNKDLLLSTFNKTIRSAWNLDNKIHEVALNEWLSNFSGRALRSQFATTEDAIDRERNLALFLLCHFVYYNENEIKYLTKLMFEKYMHKHFESNNVINVDQSKIKEALDVTVFEKLGYVSESSSFLMYLFRQVNKLSKKHFDSRTKNIIQNIVFIDDFSVSGSQAYDYLVDFIKYKATDYFRVNNVTVIESKNDTKNTLKIVVSDFNSINKFQKSIKSFEESLPKIFALFMITTKTAKAFLKNIVVNIDCLNDDEESVLCGQITIHPEIISCIILDEKAQAFSTDSIVFVDYDDIIKIQAKQMCEYYGKQIFDMDQPLGYGNEGYMFGAFYNTPDNTLPIFWSDLNGWSHLFLRYEKKYGKDGIILGGKYV